MRALGWFGVGVASAAVGLLPWLVTGMRLPLQNLAAAPSTPGEGPIVLLPFSQYALSLIVALVVVGSAIAGLAARSGRQWGVVLAGLLGGVVAVQLAALVQTAVVVSRILRDSEMSSAYLAALVAGTALSILIGVLVLVLLAKAPPAGAIVASALAAVPLASWLAGLVVPFGVALRDPNLELLSAVRWAPAIVTGLAIVWWGVASVGRVLAALGALLIVWLGPALFTAVSAAVGSRVLAGRPAEMLDYGAGVFVSALGAPGETLWLVSFTVALIILGLAVRWLTGRTRWASASGPHSPASR